MTAEEIVEALDYIRGVFPPDQMFNDLITDGARGDEEHTITGDDLAGACWHLDQLVKHFGTVRWAVPPDRLQDVDGGW